MATASPSPRPQELRLSKDKQTLVVTFDGTTHDLRAELLRVESPSAEVKGHGVGQKKLVGGKKDVTITGIDPVGTYAVQLTFSDGHRTGIYTWDYLHKLATEGDKIWGTYLANLIDHNMSREEDVTHA